MRVSAHMFMAALASALATAVVLLAVHGREHLLIHPTALALFLAGAGIGISLVALAVTGVLRAVLDSPFERLWWRSIVAVAAVSLGLLTLLEIGAR